jgi:hypothetical protein
MATALTLFAFTVSAAVASTCGGKDVLAELAATDQRAHRSIVAKAERTPNAEALLWKVEKAGRPPSYLFGTIHMTDERVTRLSENVRTAISKSKRIAVELADMSPQAMTKAMGTAAPLLINPAGNGLERQLSPSEFRDFRKTLASAGLPAEFAGLIRPWVGHLLLSMSECERARNASGLKIVDMRIAELGREAGAEVIGLETIEGQLEALSNVPNAQQIELLKMSLRLAPRINDMMETMVLLYTRRQMGAAWPLGLVMAEKSGVAASAFQGFESEILTKRNHKMTASALPMLNEGGVFVAVGALHVIGEAGLVELFRKAGYAVTAVE